MILTRTETVGLGPAARYRETFAPAVPELSEGDTLPEGWEGVYFPFVTPFDGLRPDGSPAADGVTPDFDLPRRMYAGEDTQFLRPLRIGDVVEQTARLGSVAEKKSGNGLLVFADIIREYRVEGELAIVSVWHDVFLGDAPTVSSAPAPGKCFDLSDDWWLESRTLDTRHLFRYSALTYNTHRVHYDRDWARRVEGIEDLLVHGPLSRMLTLDSAVRGTKRRPGGRASLFSFRAHAPLFVDRPFTIAGRNVGDKTEVVILGADGVLAARGTVSW